VKLDRGGFPTPELSAIVGVLDEVADDERSRGPLLAGDARLSTPSDHVVADDMVSKGINVPVVNARRVSQDYANAAGIGDSAVFDDPAFAHPRADSAHLQGQTRWRPVRCGMHEMKAVNSNVL
jgi:hypothetical protein